MKICRFCNKEMKLWQGIYKCINCSDDKFSIIAWKNLNITKIYITLFKNKFRYIYMENDVNINIASYNNKSEFSFLTLESCKNKLLLLNNFS